MDCAADSQKLPLVREFFAKKDIFITGGTGFLGKLLIEKLLRSCPEVNRIFVLIRPKGGRSSSDRLELFSKDPVFDRLRKETPQALQKMEGVSGDVREIGLGVNDADFERIRKCSVFVHSAATVRFDELITDAILNNTRGTREALLLAKRMDKLLVFNYISTTFCNPDHLHSEEKLYPEPVHWREAIRWAENLEAETFEIMSKLYIGDHPNTYTFSKRLSEHLLNDLKEECSFPVVILRPSLGKRKFFRMICRAFQGF